MAERRVGVAIDFSACSNRALRWAADNLLREGDHLILINVQGTVQYEKGQTQLWEETGSPVLRMSDFSDPSIAKSYGVYPDLETLEISDYAAKEKRAVVLVKIYWGDARAKLCEAIEKIPLDCLVIGSRGLGKIRRAILGSVSSYVVNNAPCPVTVVKGPESGN